MKTSEAHVMKRLLTYMWCYKWLTALALAFTFLTSLLLTAIPLAARWYIDHLVDPTEAGSPVPVSYTHLDVYKRQVCKLGVKKTVFLKGTDLTTSNQQMNLNMRQTLMKLFLMTTN